MNNYAVKKAKELIVGDIVCITADNRGELINHEYEPIEKIVETLDGMLILWRYDYQVQMYYNLRCKPDQIVLVKSHECHTPDIAETLKNKSYWYTNEGFYYVKDITLFNPTISTKVEKHPDCGGDQCVS